VVVDSFEAQGLEQRRKLGSSRASSSTSTSGRTSIRALAAAGSGRSGASRLMASSSRPLREQMAVSSSIRRRISA